MPERPSIEMDQTARISLRSCKISKSADAPNPAPTGALSSSCRWSNGRDACASLPTGPII
jgi:hypothetical protein